MARKPDATSNMELLLLSSLARVPMHGYELKLELRYRHVGWWAKFEHGHLYATLDRLERRGFIRQVQEKKQPRPPGRERRTFRITATGKKRVIEMLSRVGIAPDATFFDLDLFLAGAYLLPQAEVVAILKQRRDVARKQIEEAEQLSRSMGDRIPISARLIIRHRIEHLTREAAFAQEAADTISVESQWGPFLGKERITDFIKRTGVELEAER